VFFGEFSGLRHGSVKFSIKINKKSPIKMYEKNTEKTRKKQHKNITSEFFSPLGIKRALFSRPQEKLVFLTMSDIKKQVFSIRPRKNTIFCFFNQREKKLLFQSFLQVSFQDSPVVAKQPVAGEKKLGCLANSCFFVSAYGSCF
jgi:hypothetical protein